MCSWQCFSFSKLSLPFFNMLLIVPTRKLAGGCDTEKNAFLIKPRQRKAQEQAVHLMKTLLLSTKVCLAMFCGNAVSAMFSGNAVSENAVLKNIVRAGILTWTSYTVIVECWGLRNSTRTRRFKTERLFNFRHVAPKCPVLLQLHLYLFCFPLGKGRGCFFCSDLWNTFFFLRDEIALDGASTFTF